MLVCVGLVTKRANTKSFKKRRNFDKIFITNVRFLRQDYMVATQSTLS